MATVTDADLELGSTLARGMDSRYFDEAAMAIAQAIADAREAENRACEEVADDGVCSESCAHRPCIEARQIRKAIAARRGAP